MNVSVDELLKFFEIEYVEETSADEIKKGVREDLKSFAEEHEINSKAINTAYTLFKKYRSGKYTSNECDEISELSNAVDEYFSTV